MKSLFVVIFCFLFTIFGFSQKATKPVTAAPKLVVGMMVDQMRWDFIYRYQSRYGEGGFKRILREGFSCENTFIPYAQTATAAGHASVYTGSVPALNGMVGNEWYDRSLKRDMYCVEDDSVKIVGGSVKGEPMSPKNLISTTITDELELATNFKSKVVAIAIKDRGSILAAGHAADAAYWYEPNSGNFVSSTWYMSALPNWAVAFNQRRVVDSFYKMNWALSHPLETYVQSDKDNPVYKKNPFPRKLENNIGKNFGPISSTPWGNTLTLGFSKAALEAEELGKDSVTDFLAISLSSPDYIGHTFGPNSVEIEDTYIKLDKEIADFLSYLDQKVGKGQYLFFMTADHGVAHVPSFLEANQIPAKGMKPGKEAENATMAKFGLQRLVEASANYQIYLDQLNKNDNILLAFDNESISLVNLPEVYKEMFQNGYYQKLAGDVQLIYKPGYIFSYNASGTTHGSMYPYDSHIPLLWMGWGVNQGLSHRKVYMSDIAITIAALLKIQMPSGNIGSVIHEVIK